MTDAKKPYVPPMLVELGAPDDIAIERLLCFVERANRAKREDVLRVARELGILVVDMQAPERDPTDVFCPICCTRAPRACVSCGQCNHELHVEATNESVAAALDRWAFTGGGMEKLVRRAAKLLRRESVVRTPPAELPIPPALKCPQCGKRLSYWPTLNRRECDRELLGGCGWTGPIDPARIVGERTDWRTGQ
jgi:hypothetical protein